MAAFPTALNNPTLSSVQIDAVAGLAAGYSIITTAERTGVHRATIHNWLKLPEFRAALDQTRLDYTGLIQAKLQEIAVLAIDTIRHTLTDPEVSAAVKLRAALAVVDRSLFPNVGAILPELLDALATPTVPTPSVHTDTARNASCPCGSGNKYKRCCGTDAPAQLSLARNAGPQLLSS